MNITHYLITESSTPPTTGWIPVTPSPTLSITVGTFALSPGAGAKTVYAWTKDTVGNVSVLSANSHFNVTFSPPSGTIILKMELAPYNVIPNNSTYSFGTMKGPQSTGLFFTIDNTSQSDLVIESGDLSGSYYIYLQYSIAPQPFPLHHGEQVHVQINFSPKEPGDFSSVLTIKSSDPVTPVYTVYLTGKAV
jgi:hypothetical protein